jgi:hypothetical protein
MSDSSTAARRRRARRLLLAGCGLFVALIGFPAVQTPVDADTISDDQPPKCASDHDVYRLDEPGTYATFVTRGSEMASTEIRGDHGQMLATSYVSTAKMAAVDTLTGTRFGVAPPPVFDVETSVLVHVEHHNSPYELVIVRLDDSPEWSESEVRPPVTSVINESGSCLIGDLWETLEIHTDGVDSNGGGRQVFLVESPVRQR